MNAALQALNSKVSAAGIYFEYQSFEITSMPTKESIHQFEIASRTCYRSEDKMTEDLSSGENLLGRIMRFNHRAMIEFLPDLVIKIRTNRGVTHELVRHRMCSFAQESTRYVRYGDVPFIIPAWATASHLHENPMVEKNSLFLGSCLSSADFYGKRLQAGCSPQEARGSLNNDVASYINVKANIREWLHIFGLRTPKEAHPDMRVLMCGIADWLYANNELFDYLFTYQPTIVSNINWFRKNYYVEYVGNVQYIINYVDSDTNRDSGDPWADK